MKLGGNLPPGHDALLFSISGTGSFICPVAQTQLPSFAKSVAVMYYATKKTGVKSWHFCLEVFNGHLIPLDSQRLRFQLCADCTRSHSEQIMVKHCFTVGFPFFNDLYTTRHKKRPDGLYSSAQILQKFANKIIWGGLIYKRESERINTPHC